MFLQADHLYHKSNRIIFSAMQEAGKKGKTIDLVTVVTFIGKKNLSVIGGRNYLKKLMNSVPSLPACKMYEFWIRENSGKLNGFNK